MPEYKGIQYLKTKLALKQIRVRKRYQYYEMKNLTFDFGISTPPDLKMWNSCVGWCAKAVDALADRMDFRGFHDDYFEIGRIYELNNMDVLIDAAILGALIGSCDFIYISEDETGYPRLQVIDGYNATGIIEPTTGMLNEGYAVLERDQAGLVKREAYFTYEWTAYYENGTLTDYRENAAPYPLLVPIVFRPDAVRPFGHSRISRACMSLTGSALRTIKRSEISAEFYSFPQKYITGTDPNAEQMEKWKAAMSMLLQIDRNEDGGNDIKVGQFSQQSMEPHLKQLEMFASLFAGETGMTLDDLGFPQSNPSSSDAIRAAHENLRLTARKAQKTFGSGFINAGFLAACVRDRRGYSRSQIYMTKPVWAPPFPADVTMLGAIGDGLSKINDFIPGYIDEDKIFEVTGI